MKYSYKVLGFIAIFPLLSLKMNAQAPNIQAVTPLASVVEKYGKFEARIDLTAAYSNPYDYEDVRVSAVFTGPTGQVKTVDGFFMQEFQLTNAQTGALSPIGSGVFKVRFAPDEAGVWTYIVSCTNALGNATFTSQSFECIPAVSPGNKGFVRSDQSNYLHFDNEEQYIPVGENIGWGSFSNFNTWLGKLADNGGNFFRNWQCHWGWGLEWRTGGGYQGLKRYQQNNSFYLDWMFDYCNENGLYVMYCLQHHGQVSSQVNPNWSESPYNAANGGPCANTWDFFTNPAAKAIAKNRYRYVLARWGYARSVMAWELFNEVDWTDQFDQRSTDVANWHIEMAAYLKETDPYGHLVTTSYAHTSNDATTWNAPDIDFTQTHHYANIPNLERLLGTSAKNYLNIYGKPTLNGEFSALVDNTGLNTLDPDGIHVHNCLWGTLFSGAMGSSMTWWWDNYIEPKNLYYHFDPLSAFAGTVPLREKNYTPGNARVLGAPADLLLSPVLGGWGELADTAFVIADGVVSPAGAALSTFLYGSSWNTQYRRPPVFDANYPESGQFSVKTGQQIATTPKIAIWLDGALVLEQDALANQTYAISVPAGAHQIKVDNTGTDWVTIAAYRFSGLGSALDVYVLKSEDNLQRTGWLLNNSYNHDYVGQQGIPAAVSGAEVRIEGMAGGSYAVRYYDCLTGALVGGETANAFEGALRFYPPPILWDLAFVVDDKAVAVAELETSRKSLPMQVYPNPLPLTEQATVAFDLQQDAETALTLLDASGRAVQTLFDGRLSQGAQQIAVRPDGALPAGLYWIKAESGKHMGSVAVVLGDNRP